LVKGYSDNYYKYCRSFLEETVPYPQIDGMIMKEEREWLYDRATENDSIVEIGSWMGMSTHCLLSGCKGPVYAIDHFLGTPDEIDGSMAFAKTGKLHKVFMQNVGHFPNLKVLRMPSHIAVQQFKPKSIDMVFIDGDHRYDAVMEDLKIWTPICKKFLCGHDRKNDQVVQALKDFGIDYEYPPELSMWYIELS